MHLAIVGCLKQNFFQPANPLLIGPLPQLCLRSQPKRGFHPSVSLHGSTKSYFRKKDSVSEVLETLQKKSERKLRKMQTHLIQKAWTLASQTNRGNCLLYKGKKQCVYPSRSHLHQRVADHTNSHLMLQQSGTMLTNRRNWWILPSKIRYRRWRVIWSL